MFSRLLQRFRRDPLIDALNAHTLDYVSDKTMLGGLPNEMKDRMVRDFYARVASIRTADNPFMKHREELANVAAGYAEFQVLALTPGDKASAFYADCPYISGQLHTRIRDCCEHNKELAELARHTDEGATDGDLVSFANLRAVTHLYYLNGLNIVRVDLETIDDHKEWFRPFVKSMLIWQEHTYRAQLGMPDLLPNDLDGLRHSTFMNFVMNGERNPLFEWENSYKLRHSDVT